MRKISWFVSEVVEFIRAYELIKLFIVLALIAWPFIGTR